MQEGSFSLIRSVPDPMRGEIFNIGVVAWSEEFARIKIDDEAARRAVGQSRYLPRDAWTYYETYLREVLVRGGMLDQQAVEELAESSVGDTLRISCASYMQFAEGEHGFNERVEEILKRLVRSPNRGGGGGGNPVKEIRNRVKHLIDSQAVQQNYPFTQTRSTVPRFCEFFVNSGADLALDTLRLDLADQRTMLDRIDAEATKIRDVKDLNNVTFYVYCQPGLEEDAQLIEERAKSILGSEGAQPLFDIDEALHILEQGALRSEPQLPHLASR